MVKKKLTERQLTRELLKPSLKEFRNLNASGLRLVSEFSPKAMNKTLARKELRRRGLKIKK